MNLRDLIFSQQSQTPLDDVASNSNDIDTSVIFPFTQISKTGDDFLLPEISDEHFRSSPFSPTRENKAKLRFSYDNSNYYSNLLPENDDGPFYSQPKSKYYDLDTADDDQDSTGIINKRKTKKEKLINDTKRRSKMYFGRTPNPINGGKYYQHSPEFTFRHFITYNDNILNEFMINHLSFVRFPPLEESFFSFQRKVIQELLLRCYYGKDLVGFLQILNVLLEKQQVQFNDILLFVELLRYSSHRISTLVKLGTNFFSKQFMNRIHYPKHKSFLFSLLEILLEEVLLTTANTDSPFHPSLSSPKEFIGYDMTGIQRIDGLLGNVKQLLSNCQEFPSMKSVSTLWALDAVIISHQMINKVQLLLQQFQVLYEITADSIIDNPISFAAISRILIYFESSVPFKKYLHHRQESKLLLREAANCFHFVIKDPESIYWIDFHELFLGYLLGRNDNHRALRLMKELEKRYLPTEEEEKAEDNPNQSKSRKSCRELNYLKSGYLKMLLKYLIEYEFPSAALLSRKDDIRRLCSKIFVTVLLNPDEDFSRDQTALSIAWYLFQTKKLGKSDVLFMICQYLENHPPQGTENIYEFGERREEDIYTKLYEQGSYDFQRFLAWKMLFGVLGELPLDKRLKVHDPISKDCEAHMYVRNSVLSNQNFVNQIKDHDNGDDEGPLKKDWLHTLLSGCMLDDCFTTVLPFRYQEIISLIEKNEVDRNRILSDLEAFTQLSISSMEKKIEELHIQRDTTISYQRSIVTILQENVSLIASKEDLSVRSTFSVDNFSQVTNMSIFTQEEDYNDAEGSRSRRGSIDQPRSIFDVEYRLDFIQKIFEKEEQSKNISQSLEENEISDLSMKDLLAFVYDRERVDYLPLFYPGYPKTTVERKTEEFDVGADETNAELANLAFISREREHYSIRRVRRRIPQYFAQKSLQRKKESMRNHFYEHHFILGEKLLEMFCYQTIVCAHIVSQDCFLPTRTIQLLFQHFEYYSNELWKLDQLIGNSNSRSDNQMFENPYLSVLYNLEAMNEKEGAGVDKEESTIEENKEGDQKKKVQRASLIAKRNHIINCLVLLHQYGINLSRGLCVAFDWANNQISSKTQSQNYYLSEDNLPDDQRFIIGDENIRFHHQTNNNYYHPSVWSE